MLASPRGVAAGGWGMIVRKLAEAVRRQDWFTVLVEFVIVVAGIFVGLQVNNWNDARLTAKQEKAYLRQLREEVRHNIRVMDYQVVYVETVVEAGRRTLGFLQSDKSCSRQCADVVIDAFHASSIWGGDYLTNTFDELIRRGFPSDSAVRAVVQAYYRGLSGWETTNTTPPAYRERVRGFLSPDAAEALWTSCYQLIENELEVLTRDCAGALSVLEPGSIAQEIRDDPTLAQNLRFWVGQNVLALRLYPDTQAQGEAALGALDAALGAQGETP